MWLMNRLGTALSMVAVLTAGCVGLVGDDELLDPTGEPDEAPEPPDEDAPGNETAPEGTSSPPDPVVIEATALVGHPAHAVWCLNGGIDGDRHEIHPVEGGWVYAIESQDRFVVYWFGDDGFIEGGDAEGTVPGGATQAEVCMREGNVDEEYTLTLWHPDHEGASSA